MEIIKDQFMLAIEDAENCRREDAQRLRRIQWSFERGWLKVPRGLTKKKLEGLLEETQGHINDCLKRNRDPLVNEITKSYTDAWREDWMEKKRKIQNQLKFNKNLKGELNISKAKQYPIEQLIDFNGAGFAKCVKHEERTPSMKWYRQRNKVHCFSCHADMDSIDIYQIINNVDFNTAVKALS